MITPYISPSFMTAISGLLSRAMSAATSMMVSSAWADGTLRRCSGNTSRTVLVAQFVGGAVGHRLIEHTGQRGIVLDVLRHDESHHLGGGQHRVRFARRVGYHDSRQPMLGQHARSGERTRVDGYHRKVLGHLLGVHVSTIRLWSGVISRTRSLRGGVGVSGRRRRFYPEIAETTSESTCLKESTD